MGRPKVNTRSKLLWPWLKLAELKQLWKVSKVSYVSKTKASKTKKSLKVKTIKQKVVQKQWSKSGTYNNCPNNSKHHKVHKVLVTSLLIWETRKQTWSFILDTQSSTCPAIRPKNRNPIPPKAPKCRTGYLDWGSKLKWVDIGYGWVPLGPVARFDSVLATVVLVRTCLIIKQDKSWQMSGPGVFHAFLLLYVYIKERLGRPDGPLLTFFARVSFFSERKRKHKNIVQNSLEWMNFVKLS